MLTHNPPVWRERKTKNSLRSASCFCLFICLLLRSCDFKRPVDRLETLFLFPFASVGSDPGGAVTGRLFRREYETTNGAQVFRTLGLLLVVVIIEGPPPLETVANPRCS